MNITMADKRQEAIRRMNTLGIFPQTIHQFEANGQVSISEPPFGAFYWVGGDDLERIKTFEEQFDALVYMVVRSYSTIGTMDSYLYISDHQEEWEMDRMQVQNPGEGVLAYVYNHNDPDFSEFGDIGLAKTTAAGLRRIW